MPGEVSGIFVITITQKNKENYVQKRLYMLYLYLI